MAKKHKNLENLPIQWDGEIIKPSDGSAQSTPDRIDIIWGGYKPVWFPDKHATCTPVYFEDYDIPAVGQKDPDGDIDTSDAVAWSNHGRTDIADEIVQMVIGSIPLPDKGPKNQSWTWGDVSFVIEIADGIGTGNRRAREARLQQLDKDKKKRLIRLICRVKGEEQVYDETKEVYPGDIQLKLDDVDMVISKVLGTMKVSTEWEEVDWDYGYDK